PPFQTPPLGGGAGKAGAGSRLHRRAARHLENWVRARLRRRNRILWVSRRGPSRPPPISSRRGHVHHRVERGLASREPEEIDGLVRDRSVPGREPVQALPDEAVEDRKSTRLNSSHVAISYAVFCLKKKTSVG